jgi:hypothetical protein
VVATPEPKIVYGIAYRPQGRRTGEALQPPRRSVVSDDDRHDACVFLHAFDLIELNGAHVTDLLWRQLRECLLYLPTNNEIARAPRRRSHLFSKYCRNEIVEA